VFALDNITKTYQRRDEKVHAIHGINLKIDQGSFAVVTGGSGSGKTTLLLTLGGIIRPTSGSLTVKGVSLSTYSANRLAEHRSRTVGFVLQTFNLIPYLTALENVMVPMMLRNGTLGERRDRAVRLLNQTGLGDRQGFLPRELSIGQQQRVAIARALANNPDAVLADEPTGNLDPALSLEILNILKDLNVKERRTIVMVTHSPMAAEYGTMRLHLKDGRLES
jgi:putative ABC transport system ATP-binding protein